MKIWKHKPTDTKRIKILKNCAAHLQGELLDSIMSPADSLRELHEQLMAKDIARLNARIKLAAGHEAKELQIVMNFTRQRRKRMIRNKRLSIKIT